eukprot:9488046-Pyramimonas_sp.AAC.1
MAYPCQFWHTRHTRRDPREVHCGRYPQLRYVTHNCTWSLARIICFFGACCVSFVALRNRGRLSRSSMAISLNEYPTAVR